MEIYKVRNSEGLYWEGILRVQHFPNVYNLFNTEGKMFFSLSALNQELGFVEDRFFNNTDIEISDKLMLPDFLDSCKIVKFRLQEIETFELI